MAGEIGTLATIVGAEAEPASLLKLAARHKTILPACPICPSACACRVTSKITRSPPGISRSGAALDKKPSNGRNAELRGTSVRVRLALQLRIDLAADEYRQAG